jgi:hypothetical protein
VALHYLEAQVRRTVYAGYQEVVERHAVGDQQPNLAEYFPLHVLQPLEARLALNSPWLYE